MGFTGVSFYVDWSLVEANAGHVITNGIWSLDKFFDAASQAGLYLIARPGPYINAETTGGGIPGWVLRKKAVIRSDDPEYLNATANYVSTLGEIIERAQITHGGPVIMVQPENEYSTWPGVTDFPNDMNRNYMAYVEHQLLDQGITVPSIVNDNLVEGYFAPGSGQGAVNIYAIDAYPMRYDCFHMIGKSRTNGRVQQRPFPLLSSRGGSGEGWGGVVQNMCGQLVNEEAARVVYKNNYSFGVKIFNIYMTFGGTNWGNLGYMGGHTSYDYGAAITEERAIWREKYSEQKLEANFLKVSPAYLTATPRLGVNGTYGAPPSIAVTALLGNGTQTNFYVVRHADFTSTGSTQYTLTLSTSIGHVEIPQLGGYLMLNGRDSKFHVTDYDIGGINLIYSSAEIFTWARGSGSARVLILYGGAGETHEFALPSHLGKPTVLEGQGHEIKQRGSAWLVQWHVTPARGIIRVADLQVYLLWRNEAYNYWVMELPESSPIGNYSSPSKSLVVVKAGYLVRTADLINKQLRLTGDVNATTEIEIISSPATKLKGITFNGEVLQTSQTSNGNLWGTVRYDPPKLDIPDLSNLEWKSIDSLPEIKTSYDDSAWTPCTRTSTHNPRQLDTPDSLYSMDYGYHTGSLLYRGHFNANGQESNVWLNVSGGLGFGHSVWLNTTFLGSWVGSSANSSVVHNMSLPSVLSHGSPYVITVLIDHMGQDEEAPGTDAIKFPRGILNYEISGHTQSDVSWRLTDGLPHAGVGFYAASFQLDLPSGWDVPMSVVFNNSIQKNTEGNTQGKNYRCQLFVNGYQFGKYINNLGPQTAFPVPEGILNHGGNNHISLTLWAQDKQGAKLEGLKLVPTSVIRSGYSRPQAAPQPAWKKRAQSY
ncbi:Glycoside hydrolase family 35 [Penicillium expansum]|nr:Glycoside hydrolase family 35 [Penicillium expansum]